MTACYDKEIYYYTNVAAEDVDENLFETTSKEKFIESLKTTRDELISNLSSFLPQEPFALSMCPSNGWNGRCEDMNQRSENRPESRYIKRGTCNGDNDCKDHKKHLEGCLPDFVPE